MSELEHEKAFEEYLSRRSRIGGRAGDEGLEPPAELDRIVLANAREAIRVRPAAPVYRGVRWALPVGLAATVVLSFAVLLHLGLLPRPGADSDAPIEAHFHPDPAAGTEPAADPALVTPAPPSAVLDMSSSPDDARAPARNKEATARLSKPELEDRQDDRQAQPLAERTAQAAVASNRAALPAASGKAPAPAEVEDPAAWLRRIAALRAQGKDAQANREWQAFRKAWPDYPVPAEQPR